MLTACNNEKMDDEHWNIEGGVAREILKAYTNPTYALGKLVCADVNELNSGVRSIFLSKVWIELCDVEHQGS